MTSGAGLEDIVSRPVLLLRQGQDSFPATQNTSFFVTLSITLTVTDSRNDTSQASTIAAVFIDRVTGARPSGSMR